MAGPLGPVFFTASGKKNLRCKSTNGCGRLWNRDVNGSLNIRMLALDALKKRKRNIKFQRYKNSCDYP